MKRLVDLLRINEGRFTAIILSVMTIAALISLKGNLISGGAGRGTACCVNILCAICTFLYIICRKV